ncbi:hypothetical protein OC861_001750 [Tilletia horrida]|nr:hypothetical protein OC861_001750 [Tilletia horrida]
MPSSNSLQPPPHPMSAADTSRSPSPLPAARQPSAHHASASATAPAEQSNTRSSPLQPPSPPSTNTITTSTAQGGVPAFLERRNSDAFKFNVLPAIGPPHAPSSNNRGMPRSPQPTRSSTSAGGIYSDSMPSAHPPPFSHRNGAPSSASSASSIASVHGLPYPQREISPPGPPHNSRSNPSGAPSHLGTGPPQQQQQHGSANASGGPSNFSYRNGAGGGAGATPSSWQESSPYSHAGRRDLDSADQYQSSGPNHRAPISSFTVQQDPDREHNSRYPGSHQHGSAAHNRQGSEDPGDISSASNNNNNNNQVGNSSIQAHGPDDGGSSGQTRGSGGASALQNAANEAADPSKAGASQTDRKVSCLECRASKVSLRSTEASNIVIENAKFQKLEKSLENVTRAFNDFRKLQDPVSKTGEGSKHLGPHEADEPVKKKARRATATGAGEHAAPDPTVQQPHVGNVSLDSHPHAMQQDGLRGSVSMGGVGPPGQMPEHRRDSDDPHRPVISRDSSGRGGGENWHPYGPGGGRMPASGLTAFPLAADSRCRDVTIGSHLPLPDGDLSFDPIGRNVVTLREARESFDTFMHLQNQYFPSLDPALHTFEFVRDRSPFLLSTVCAIAARFTEAPNSGIASRLQQYLASVLIPDIWLKGLRSVEIVQGFTLLATFHELAVSAADDRTWQYLSLAFGQAIQLGLNRRPKLPESATMLDQRMARNGERCWLVLFLVEVITAQQMGRRSMFTIDRFIGSSDNWHLHMAALPADRNIIALVQLRRTQIRLHDLFESTIADPASGEPALTAYRFDIFNLDTWKHIWYDSISWAPHEQGISREILFAYLSSTLMQYVLTLRACPDGETAASILRQASRTAVDALNVLILFDWPDLVFAVNQNVVLSSYCAILALRMTTHQKRWRGTGAIDPLYIYDLVDKLITSLSRHGGTLRRSATAMSYASYLGAVLDHFQEDYEVKMSKSSTPYAPLKRRHVGEMNVREFEAAPSGVTAIPKHPHTGVPALLPPPRSSLFSDMTFFDTFFEDL